MVRPPPPPRLLLFLALFFVVFSSTSAATLFPFNASLVIRSSPTPDLTPTALSSSDEDPSSSQPSFLEEVVKAIAAKERWDPKAQVRVSDLDYKNAKFGVAHRYDFRLRIGRTALDLKFADEIVSWRKADAGGVVELGSDLVAGDGIAGLEPAVRPLELIGPLELRIEEHGNDRMLLRLPDSNMTHRGLKQIFVGNGVKVKVEGAQEVSFIHPYDIGLSLNGNLAIHVKDRNKFWHLGYSSCAPLLSVFLVGSASVSAQRNNNAFDEFEAAFKAPDTVELSPKKCFGNDHVKQTSSCLFCSVNSRLALLEKQLRNFLGSKTFQIKSTRFLKVKITSSTLVKFHLDLERDITKNDRSWKKVPEWKQKPKVERVWLEIVATVKRGRSLKLVLVRKLKRPHTIADSISWNSLMSNISFTQFQSLVVSPEALTLDVKW